MDAQQALADLTEISSQIRSAVVFDDKGKVAGATGGQDGEGLAKGAAELLDAAEGVKIGGSQLTQLEVSTAQGSVFVVREGKTTIAATTAADPTVGLVFYDLKSALRSLKPKPKQRAAKPKTAEKPKAAEKPKGAAPKKKPTPRKRKPDAS